MHANTSRFVSAYNKIHKRMNALVPQKGYTSFVSLLEKAAAKDNAIRQNESTLRYFADLRNMLVHGHDHDNEVAVPCDTTVAQLEELAEVISSPPLLLKLAIKNVEQCHPSDLVGSAARTMYKGCFSQLPVYDGKTLVGLLTGETIARWLAIRSEGNLRMFDEESVSAVLEYQETPKNFSLLSKAATAFDGLSVFDESLHSGGAVQAIIITANAKRTDMPLGILTPTDIPRILREIQRSE